MLTMIGRVLRREGAPPGARRRYSALLDVAQRLTGAHSLTPRERTAALDWLQDAAPGLTDDELCRLDTPQLAQLLGACAMAKPAPHRVFMRSAKVLGTPEHLRAVDCKSFASLAYAYATAGVPARSLLARLAAQLCPPPPEDETLAPGAGTHTDVTLLPRVQPVPASGCVDLSGLGVLQLARLAWSYARLSQHTPALFEAVAREAEGRLGKFGAADLSMLCFALGSSGYADRPASARLLARAATSVGAPEKLRRWTFSLLCALACGYTHSCEPVARGRVLCAVARRLTPLAQADRDAALPRELATLLWAFAVSAEGCQPHAHALVLALTEEVHRREAEAFGVVEMQQVHHALSVLAIEAPGLRLSVPPRFVRAAQRWGAQALQRRPRDATASSLSTALHAAGVEHAREHKVEGTPFVVDLALPSAKLALELRGFHSHLQRRAADECKARVLRRLGWQLEVIDSHPCAQLSRAQRLGEVAALIRAGQVDGLDGRVRELAARLRAERDGYLR